MDPARLRLLRELRDRGSVAAVAAAMHVTASAVSQQLATLQAGAPVPLTRKRGRNLVLTEAGIALADAGLKVDEALAAADAALDSYLTRTDRTVSVSAFHSAALALFGPLVEEMAGRVALSFRDADVAGDEFAGLTAEHDIVIAHRLPHEPHWPASRVHVAPLLTEPLDVALHHDHPLAAQQRIRPEQLRDERWISVHDGFPLAGVLQHLGALAGRPLHVDHRINELFVAARVVRTGAAVAIMPRYTAASLAVDGVVLRPVAGARLVRHVDALTRPDSSALTPVRTVLRALRKVAGDAAGLDRPTG